MKPKIYLAPMSGITDLPFRLVSREFGAEQCFFEMLDAHVTLCGHPASRRPLKTVEQDTPIAAQLVGSDPCVMLDAAQKVRSLVDISFLDINSACPVKKIIKKGAGAALLENTATLANIITTLSSRLPIPITVKLRTGFNTRDIKKSVATAKLCEAHGASMIFIHGRTRSQGYAGNVDYESIKAVKEAVSIPVVGSGNIFAPVMAKKMLDETGCDGLLVARGALGNPWLFRGIEHYLHKGGTFRKPALGVRKKVLAKHLAYIEQYNDMTETNRAGYKDKVTTWYLEGPSV